MLMMFIPGHDEEVGIYSRIGLRRLVVSEGVW
jgi:hypothetical protein